MAATKERYRSLQVSERLAPPLTLCRAACTGMAVMFMSMGESCTYSTGKLWGNRRIQQALEEARKLTGEPNRKGYNQTHVGYFLQAFGSTKMTKKQYIYNKERKDIRESLRGDYVITMAGDVAGTRLESPLRKYVNGNVGHELLFFDWEGDWRTGTVAVIDPMQPQSKGDYVRRVPAKDMWAFGKKYLWMSRYICERFKIGSQTKAAQVARDRAAVILDLQNRILTWRSAMVETERELQDVEDELKIVMGKLDACRSGGGIPVEQEQNVVELLRQALVLLSS